MTDITNILKVGNPKLDKEPQDSNERRMSRRAFITKAATLAGSLVLLGYTLVQAYRARQPKSIDDYANPTEVMINRLSKVNINDINLLGVEYGETKSYSKVCAIIEDPSIIQQYFITYYFQNISLTGNKTVSHEEMTIDLIYPPGTKESPIDREGHRYWHFRGNGPLDVNSDFWYSIYNEQGGGEPKKFEQGYGGAAIVNVRNLLDINNHIQKRKAQKPI